MVPWSLDTQSREESELKLMQNMVAGFDPRRSSVTRLPFTASNTRIRVPFTLAVANLVPITKQFFFYEYLYIDCFTASLTEFGTKIFKQFIQCPETDKSCFLATKQRTKRLKVFLFPQSSQYMNLLSLQNNLLLYNIIIDRHPPRKGQLTL